MAKVGVIGAGSWGIALAKLLRTNGNEVTVWSIVEEEVAMLRREHEHIDKLPGVKLPEDVLFTTDLKEAIVGKEFLILAVPSVFTRSTAKSTGPPAAIDKTAMRTRIMPLKSLVLNILFLLYAAISAFSVIVLVNGSFKFLFIEIRPRHIGKIKLRISQLPHQEVRKPFLSAGAD